MAQATLLLIEDYKAGFQQADLAGLREQLSQIPEFTTVEVSPAGRSTVYITVPARNSKERDRLKSVIDKRVNGWHVIEESGYSLPKTF